MGTALAGTFSVFVAWRLLGGVAIGLASSLSPMYIAEVSPGPMRGMFVSINQLTIVIGLACPAHQLPHCRERGEGRHGFADPQLLERPNGLALDVRAYRRAVGAFLILMFLVPESPRWLAKNGKPQKALAVLAGIGGESYAQAELADIEETLANEIEKVDFRELFEPGIVKILFLGITLAVFQQWCGINVIFNYAEEIFAAADYGVNETLLNIVATGAVCLVFTFVAIFTVDRLGRRWLMLAGSAGLALLYTIIGAGFHGHWTGHPFVARFSRHGLLRLHSRADHLGHPFRDLSQPHPRRGHVRGSLALWTGCFTLTYSFSAPERSRRHRQHLLDLCSHLRGWFPFHTRPAAGNQG